MHATTVRFSDDLWTLLEGEASEQGISAAQFVRDSAMMRLGALSGHRGDAKAAVTLEALAAGALRTRPTTALEDPERIAALHGTGLLDSPPAETFDRLTRMAAAALAAPVALVSLVDRDRQFFKSATGLGEPWHSRRETPLSHSFCRHTLDRAEPLLITDARTHPLVRENLAIRDLNVIAYAGVPLITTAGHTLGVLCVIDHVPRAWTTEQIDALGVLAAAAVAEIERLTRPATPRDRPGQPIPR